MSEKVKVRGQGQGEGVGLCRSSRSTVVAVLWFLLVATVVGTYELGYQRGQIAALESEVTR